MTEDGTTRRHFVLATLPAGPGGRRFAATVAVLSLAVCIAAAPFARLPLPRVPAFIPAYESALVISDLITAALLFGQSAMSRSRALLALAGGYLFTALMTVAHGLSFPGLLSAGGLLGGGAQSTAWLYMFWHGGFPVAVVCYALLKGRGEDLPRHAPLSALLSSAAGVIGLVVALTLLATAGEGWLPGIMQNDGYAPAMRVVVAAVWSLSAIALVVLYVGRPHSVLDLWLMVVMCAWLCDVALSALLNAGRFDLGFYIGRIHGLAAASLVLIVLLIETIALYARQARLLEAERQERERRLDEMHLELVHVSRLSELGQMVSALTHEVTQPLTAIGNYILAAQRMVRAGNAEMAQSALARASDEVTRASKIIQRLRNFIKKGESEQRVEDLRTAIDEAVTLALIGTGRRDVAVDMRLHPEAPVAFIDKIQFQQVLLNLLRNAIEATTDGATPSLVIAATPSANDMIEVSVADRGPGLAAVVKERLFRPFVTTKTTGMGVGLSICQSIIEAHGGRIWAADNPDGGTVFRFTVPCPPQEITAREAG